MLALRRPRVPGRGKLEAGPVIFLRILCGLAGLYVLISALEYFPHRWVMHSQQLARRVQSPRLAEEWERHGALHHGQYYPPGRFTGCLDRAARFVSIDTGPAFMLASTWWLWLPLAIWCPWLGVPLALALAAHGVVWSLVHREMHRPARRWVSQTLLFRFWCAYHEAHHERPGMNFNVLLPLFDHLLGTHAGRSAKEES